MKVKKVKNSEKIISSLELKVGDMMRLRMKRYLEPKTSDGEIVLKTYIGIISLNNPYTTWSQNQILYGEKLNKGEQIVLEQE